jgi:site-specific DNA-methyltransferase (cytosine-N4-specific)
MGQLVMPFRINRPVIEETGVFSHDQVCDDTERMKLEQRYADIIQETDRFSRKTVSFQANKVSSLHNWFKYREGFSAELVEILLHDFSLSPGDTVLDPFAGSCTTLLEAKMMGINGIGVELLPHCHLAWHAKSRVYDYQLAEIEYLRQRVELERPPPSSVPFPHLQITASAFPTDVERDLVSYSEWFSALPLSDDTKLLARAMLMSILEDVSYTRKDGQYLRWDSRAGKIVSRNAQRVEQGRPTYKGIDKGRLPDVQSVLLARLDMVVSDIAKMQKDPPAFESRQQLVEGSALLELPRIPGAVIDAVITSPPYANRYDYTRTYALELAFLGVHDSIFSLRQDLLSCTVENRTKEEALRQHYAMLGAESRLTGVLQVVNQQPALREVLSALELRDRRGETNNSGVLRMVKQYFEELAIVYAELYRLCRPGAHVAFVNDNVRYAGEIVPVDLISTALAESFGFEAIKVYVIPQRKGNSSQQMKKFGRQELRKSITIWRKPPASNS